MGGLTLIAALQGCAMVGVELVDSADLAELETANTPEPEAVDEAELDDALSRMIADLERSLEAAAVEAKEDAVAEDGTYVVKNGDYLDKSSIRRWVSRLCGGIFCVAHSCARTPMPLCVQTRIGCWQIRSCEYPMRKTSRR